MALLAGVIVTISTGAALATGVLTQIHEILPEIRNTIVIPEVEPPKPGKPRTILILGSDARYEDKKTGVKPRSDTILLIRANPRNETISVLSIPRDLKADIPGHGPDKINAAFEEGGPRLTVRTIKQLFETATGEDFPINNVVNVDFSGFRRAVDYIGGVYVDVDRRYFNDITGPGGYAAIDIDPGYQRLKGQDALDYVRYRHTDDDFARAARQQGFLRQARSQRGVRRLVSIRDRERLMKVFGRYFKVDRGARSTKQVLSMIKLAFSLVQGSPSVHQVKFKADYAADAAVDTRLYASKEQVAASVREFMNPPKPAPATQPEQPRQADRSARPRRERSRGRARLGDVPGMVGARAVGADQAALVKGKLDFPFYFPSIRTELATYPDGGPRTYTIRDEKGRRHDAYRLVIATGDMGQYYGIQGMTWKHPPILDDPDGTTTVDGRRYRLYRDGRKIRLVAWETKRGVYWVSNTLTAALSNRQMLATAQSLTRR
jgi:LCP family protein required for cell wall assembly